jgi:hypothetical protein
MLGSRESIPSKNKRSSIMSSQLLLESKEIVEFWFSPEVQPLWFEKTLSSMRAFAVALIMSIGSWLRDFRVRIWINWT